MTSEAIRAALLPATSGMLLLSSCCSGANIEELAANSGDVDINDVVGESNGTLSVDTLLPTFDVAVSVVGLFADGEAVDAGGLGLSKVVIGAVLGEATVGDGDPLLVDVVVI